MDIYDAVETRRAVRSFTGRQVPKESLERVLAAAARSPSGGNIQPWSTYVVTGAPLAELKQRASERFAAGDPGEEQEFDFYPPDLKPPYLERKFQAGAKRFSALGIARADEGARNRHIAENWSCFGAPAALFCYIDRSMGSAQWADIGMYLQSVMLLLRAEGLHSCPQKAWSVYQKTVAQVVAPSPELILFCGMSIGYADETERFAWMDRAPLAETVTFLD
ncbi:MAG TPA: nitroreductase [Actinocrinis sp.]|jgi:nitroreductase